jgi:hypothetical protein
MTETSMSLTAIAVELGLPMALLAIMVVRPATLPKAIVILGAVFPLLCFYAAATISHLLGWETSSFAFYAMWAMTLFWYVVLAFVGLALSFLGWPSVSWARFGIGILSTPLTYIGVMLLTAVGVHI